MFQKSSSIVSFILAMCLLVPLCSATVAPVTSVTTDNPPGTPPYNLTSVTVGTYTVDVSGLASGTSTTTLDPVKGLELPVMDDLEIGTQYSSGEPTDAFTVHMFGGRLWMNSNGDEPDFFLFEAGGQDNPVFAAILPGGVLGQEVTIPATDSLWGSLGDGYTAPSNGQQLYGVSFAITDLLDADGNPLTNNSLIEGLAVTNRAGLDPSDWCAVASAPILTAMSPDPADGALHLDTWANLGWLAGETAASHDIYISESFDDVNGRTAEAFRGNQPLPSIVVGFVGFPFPDGLVPGTTYYWAVDEVESEGTTKHKGAVWSFTVPPTNAYNPDPADGRMFVNPDVTLSWTAGFGAKLHTVYFGDSFDDVNNATGGAAVATTTFTPGTLELDKTYYWRVDEFNPPVTIKGDVWSFTTLPNIPITDPNLIGWWKFEAGGGDTVVDFSGHGNHGTIVDKVLWVPGQHNLALEFLGDNQGHVELPGLMLTSASGSVAMWVSTDLTDDEGMFWYGTQAGGDGDGYTAEDNEMHLNVDDPGHLDFYLGGGGGVTIDGPSIVGAGWIHLAATWDLTDGIRLYVNGVQVGSAAHTGLNADLAVARLGRPIGTGNGNRYHDGLMDDVRLFNHAITAAQVNEIMTKGEDPLRAGTPSPGNGSSVAVNVASTLSWSAGEGASQHDVYFGADRAAVAGADASDTTGVYRGRQNGTSYTPPEGVPIGSGPHYWRIDEVASDGTIVGGSVWSFSVTNYALVDDFESYNDIPPGEPGSNLVYVQYKDGVDNPNFNGSTIGYFTGASMETGNVHGGGKSVPLAYNNTTASVSEVVRTFSPARDWTEYGVKTLSLWFAGADTNVPGQFYVKVNGVQVNYDGDSSNLTQAAWQSWNIDLASIGVDLSSVTSLAIGV
ncbi:MAG: LamG domain-containing protein, partial [Phycisphaerales bacterium]